MRRKVVRVLRVKLCCFLVINYSLFYGWVGLHARTTYFSVWCVCEIHFCNITAYQWTRTFASNPEIVAEIYWMCSRWRSSISTSVVMQVSIMCSLLLYLVFRRPWLAGNLHMNLAEGRPNLAQSKTAALYGLSLDALYYDTIQLNERLSVWYSFNTSHCHPKDPVFDSHLQPRNFTRSIRSETGSTQPREANWLATWYEK